MGSFPLLNSLVIYLAPAFYFTYSFFAYQKFSRHFSESLLIYLSFVFWQIGNYIISQIQSQQSTSENLKFFKNKLQFSEMTFYTSFYQINIFRIIYNLGIMNRVTHHIIQEGSTIPYQKCKMLQTPHPDQTGFRSQKFPIYPITLNMLLDNPPFNKISLAFQRGFIPQSISILGSQNGLQYLEIKTIAGLQERWEETIHIFEKKLFYSYIKLVFRQPNESKENICKQIKIRGLQVTMVTLFQTNFVCSLKAKVTYHPILFRLLEILEYKSIILKQDGNKLYQKYVKRLQQLTKILPKKKYQMITVEQITKWQAEIVYLQSQPIIMDSFISYPDPIKAKRDVFKLQKQLQTFAIDRQMSIKPQIKHYFQRHQNKTIRQNYLQQLSSNKAQQHSKALVNFWNQLKLVEPFTTQIQDAALVFFNFYLQFLDFPLKVNALKSLILLNKQRPTPKDQSLEKFYVRILRNLIKFIHLKEDQDLYNFSIKYTYTIFQKISNDAFIQQLLNAHKSYSLPQRIQKLEILQKITFRGVQINNRKQIVQFLIDFLLEKDINLTDKNRAYNIAAYLASIHGKQNILKDFQKLNSMILMTMQRSIDGKLGKISSKGHVGGQQITSSCQFCGLSNPNFKDDNLYDLHLAKQCKFITVCQYCSQNVQIPQLFKHYIEQCTSKHEFKHCENCFQVILAKDQETHNKGCKRKLETKCPLCYEKVQSKLKLKEHLLGKGCPNNPR